MKKMNKRLHPLHGILFFILVMALFLLVFAPLQQALGMAGLALTEFGLLLLSFLVIRLTGQAVKEVIPISAPKFGQLLGTIFIWGGSFLISMVLSMILMYFFPEGFLEVSSSLTGIMSSVHPILGFLIVAVMPAICEEAMHRGFILYTFKRISQDWVTVLCMGLIFGIFHLDPYRFVPTAILGMGLTYCMLKSRNFLLPALFHGINNAVSFLSSLGTSSAQLEESAEMLSDPAMILLTIGSYLMLGALAPILLYVGSYLLRKASGCLPKRSDTKVVLSVVAVIIISVLMLAAGLVIILFNMGNLLEMEELMQEMAPYI